jgi:DNA-binding transcriptional MocR family regulator
MAGGLAGQAIAVDAAAYTGGLVQARAMRCPLIGCAIDEEGMLPESLREHCTSGEPRIAAIYVTPTVHNPLGFVTSLARREALVEVAREFDLLIIEDDAYGFMEPYAPPKLAKLAPERTFYVRGLSKSYAPAARTGFLVVPERFLSGMLSVIQNAVTGSSLVHNRAAVSLIEDGTLDRVIAEKNAEGARRNAAARSLLGDCCWPGARAAWHLWVNLPSHTTPQWFEKRMAEREVLLSGGNWFAVGQDAPNGFRLALGGEVDRERALEGVARIVEELHA